MRFLPILAGIIALVQSCLCLDELDSIRLVYYYAVYDLDVEVWNQGNGYIAPECKGVVIEDGRCTFDEFANFVAIGDSSTKPSYYDLSSGFSFVAGDIAAMVKGLEVMDQLEEGYQERVVKGRMSTLGLFEDLGKIIDKNVKRADERNIGITRHWHNVEEAMGGLRVYLSAELEGGLVERLQQFNDEVILKIVDRESDYRNAPWKQVDWQATVAANPDLALPSSTLYQNTVEILKGTDDVKGTMIEKSIAQKVALQFKTCFG